MQETRELKRDKTLLEKKFYFLIEPNFPSVVSQCDAMNDYVRTMTTNQFYGSLFSPGWSYRSYVTGGHYITGYDLTAAQSGGNLPFTAPATKKGLFCFVLFP